MVMRRITKKKKVKLKIKFDCLLNTVYICVVRLIIFMLFLCVDDEENAEFGSSNVWWLFLFIFIFFLFVLLIPSFILYIYYLYLPCWFCVLFSVMFLFFFFFMFCWVFYRLAHFFLFSFLYKFMYFNRVARL